MRIILNNLYEITTVSIETDEGKLVAKLYIHKDGTLLPDSWMKEKTGEK